MRLAMLWFFTCSLMLSFCLGDMIKIFGQAEFFYPLRPSGDGEAIPRYETLYFVDRAPRF